MPSSSNDPKTPAGSLSSFLDTHFRHFNAATLVEAADDWTRLLDSGGKMFLSMAGAMSTAELGRSLAEMIRKGKVHAICCTGANLEEDVFNLVAHDHYKRIPDWRSLSAEDEKNLERSGLNRVTDTCIPEEEAMRVIERRMIDLWRCAADAGERLFPHEFMYRLLRDGDIVKNAQSDPADSWLLAACEADLPIFVPGWEDSTLGNVIVANVMRGDLPGFDMVRSGLESMRSLVDWYCQTTMGLPASDLPAVEEGPEAVDARTVSPDDAAGKVGFFQIGGGIAGDFPICAVPLIQQDLCRACPYWAYFCQVSDSTTSYGSYSGAVPNEKITWGKLDVDTPSHIIESDATIVVPLVFARVLGW